jgi:hypothetical protein
VEWTDPGPLGLGGLGFEKERIGEAKIKSYVVSLEIWVLMLSIGRAISSSKARRLN